MKRITIITVDISYFCECYSQSVKALPVCPNIVTLNLRCIGLQKINKVNKLEFRMNFVIGFNVSFAVIFIYLSVLHIFFFFTCLHFRLVKSVIYFFLIEERKLQTKKCLSPFSFPV